MSEGHRRVAGFLRRRGAWLALSVTAAVALLVLTGWFWRHPTALLAHSDGYGFTTRTTVGQVLWVSATVPGFRGQPETHVQIDSVVPHITRGSGAVISAWVCDHDIGRSRSSTSAFGTGSKNDVLRYCTRLTRANGADLVFTSTRREQLLLRIEGRRPGVIRMQGVDVSYSEGWRVGSQRIGPTISDRVGSGF